MTRTWLLHMLSLPSFGQMRKYTAEMQIQLLNSTENVFLISIHFQQINMNFNNKYSLKDM